MAREIFISYSQPDRECAFELVERIEADGIGCWIAPRDIVPSADWASEIMDAISSARAMILVFSSSSNQSPQVRREVERAVHRQLSILPFRIEDVLPSKSLEFFLSTQHWMDAFPPPREPHYLRLCRHLRQHLSAPPPSAADTAGRVQRASPVPAVFDADRLRRIERQLANYVGPIAGHLVKTAALRAADIDALMQSLAQELDSDQERREFNERCRREAGQTQSRVT